MNNSSLVTANQLAEMLNLSVETIWRYTRNQRIPYITLGERQYRYNPQAVITVLAQGVQESKPQYESRQYTYQDYQNLPETMMHTEILDGKLVQEPAPMLKHQTVLMNLYRLLQSYYATHDPQGMVYVAPVDVTLSDTVVVQPDLFYVSGKRLEILTETRIIGAPDLIVEVTSPSSIKKDRIEKYEIYQRFGIPHYWLVDAPGQFIETYSFSDQGIYIRSSAASEGSLTLPAFPGLKLDVSTLWLSPIIKS
jgi:Uma2 family endonuclease